MGGGKWMHCRPQVYPFIITVLLSRVINMKYGCFPFTFKPGAGDFLLWMWPLDMKFSEENKRKIEAKEIPSFLIPCPLIVFETWSLENILVTAL